MGNSQPQGPRVAESIASGSCVPLAGSPPGVQLRVLVSEACGAAGICTGTATFAPSSEIPAHFHSFSEVITVLSGCLGVAVEGREYWIQPHDAIHVPAGTVHAVRNRDRTEHAVAHWSFASAEPSRTFVPEPPIAATRGLGAPEAGDPESVVRFEQAPAYELAPGALFRDLFAGRLGSASICGGYGRLQPGSSLPCHVHSHDGSITIIEGQATCLAEGNRYSLSHHDTAYVPQGKPHRFRNDTESFMAMIWVYAGSEPERSLVTPGYCDGSLVWPEVEGGRPIGH